MERSIKLKVNGKPYEGRVSTNRLLIDLLRDDLGLTGTKLGCGEGECGVCTVLMDHKAVCSCLILAAEADGSEITTIEGLAQGGEIHPLQQAFIDEGASQCGYCTPGMILSAKGLLEENSDPSLEDIKHALQGNLCRCTGYASIIRAVQSAVKGGNHGD